MRLLRASIAAIAVLASACNPKGTAPPCAAVGQSFCQPATGASFCTALPSDPANCGTCSNKCASPSGGTATCSAGVCGGGCTGGKTACSGACTDTTVDHENCGACGTA